MEEKKITEIPEAAFRAFSRVDAVKCSPAEMYDSLQVPQQYRAEFVLKPADPMTLEELRQIAMTLQSIYLECYKLEGAKMGDKGTEESLRAWVKFSQASRYHMSTQEVRWSIAKCVESISNYYVAKDGGLEKHDASVGEIMATIPVAYVEWAYQEVQKLSGLTTAEVLGV